MEKSYWLWYPGDFERYYAMKQNFSRVERGFGWPAFWKSEGFRNRVAFRRDYTVGEAGSFTVLALKNAVGFVRLDEKKYPFGAVIPYAPGPHSLSVHIACLSCMPSVYIAGGQIRSDEGWLADDFDEAPVPAACSRYFTDPARDPSEWPYAERIYEPEEEEEINGGVLYRFETELTAALEVTGMPERKEKRPLLFLGESRAEALDTENCYFFCRPDENGRCPRQALRWVYVPECRKGDFRLRAVHQYVDLPVRAAFRSADEELNRIYAVAAHTFLLCSDVFFLDGIKRDKWIWGGDAYLSLFINRCLTGDKEIEQRTLTALIGKAPITTHVNTILDYSLLWILGMEVHYDGYRDEAFLARMRPQMESLTALILSQREEHGFVIGRERDWVFVDWADFDREGPLCAEQMLLFKALRVMSRLGPAGKQAFYAAEAEKLAEQIERFFWDPEKGAYIDSFTSGRRRVTRHANIWAILFDVAGPDRKEHLVRNVLLGRDVPALKTPYFRFFELEALCRMGRKADVLAEIRRYWGGMLKRGAVTFWEEFDPEKPQEEQYAMYGDPFGKSLCHAWAASPVYFLKQYFSELLV